MKNYIENWGISKVEFFYYFFKKVKFKKKYKNIEELFNSKKIYIFILLSFLIGALLHFL